LTSLWRRFCFSTDDFLAIFVSLFFSSWPFLALFTVWIFLVNDVQAAFASH
jgi:hypothetical protein